MDLDRSRTHKPSIRTENVHYSPIFVIVKTLKANICMQLKLQKLSVPTPRNLFHADQLVFIMIKTPKVYAVCQFMTQPIFGRNCV